MASHDFMLHALMKAVDYTVDDLDRPVHEFCAANGLFSPSDLGLTHKDIMTVEAAMLRLTPTVCAVRKDVVARVLIYRMMLQNPYRPLHFIINNVYLHSNLKAEVLGHPLTAFPPPSNGNVFNYVMSFPVEDIIHLCM